MSLIREIQRSAVDPQIDVTGTLFKVYLLAQRIDSSSIVNWVRGEMLSFQSLNSVLPLYRLIEPTFRVSETLSGNIFAERDLTAHELEIITGTSNIGKLPRLPVRLSFPEINRLVKLDSPVDEQHLTSNEIEDYRDTILKTGKFLNVSVLFSNAELAHVEPSIRLVILNMTYEMEKKIPNIKKLGVDDIHDWTKYGAGLNRWFYDIIFPISV